MWENNEYKMHFNEDTVLDFERIMLTSGECDYLLPMIFLGEGSEQVAYYDCRGLSPLSRYKIDRTEDAFYILEKVLIIMSCVVEYLIDPEKVMLTTDTIFFNVETGEIKIAYVPSIEVSASLRKHILALISELKADVEDDYQSYLDSFAVTVHRNNYQIRDLVNKLGLIRRELYLKTNASS